MATLRWIAPLLGLLLCFGCDGGVLVDDDSSADDDDVTDDDDATDDDVADDDVADDDDTVDPNDVDGDGYSIDDGDCDDNDPGAHPGAEEIAYDGVDQDCDGSDLLDVDGDGYEADWFGGEDCDDNDASINPDGTEVCGDGIDGDCSGDPDDASTDGDGDGFVDWECTGGDDCDDGDASIKPYMEVYVPGDFSDPQAAVQGVCSGSTIYVEAGSYFGNVDGRDKSLALIGIDGAASTSITGDGSDSVVVLGGDGGASELSGMTITSGNGSSGGGLQCTGDCTVNDVVFTLNEAISGGGAALLDGQFVITGVTFDDNSSDWGGGLFIDSSTGTIDDSTFTDNVAEMGGGALTSWYSDVDMDTLQVSGNSSSLGAGLYLYYGTLSLSNSTIESNSTWNFIGNQAGGTAGGLYTRDSTVDLQDNIITLNYARWGGGGYYCWDCTLTNQASNDISNNEVHDCDDYVYPVCEQVACRSCTGCTNG